ncbi:protein RCC2 [Hordeum vulgare]|nr:protein RCC2 [Hordeum vulgare]
MPPSAAGSTAEGEEKGAEAGRRELLYCGTVRFDIMGRPWKGGREGRGNLVSPTRLRPLVGVDIRFVASGCGEFLPPILRARDGIVVSYSTASLHPRRHVNSRVCVATCHCVALTSDGRCFSRGRNENGQLGHGDTLLRNLPTVVSELSKYNIIAAGVGRKHTVVVTDEGMSFAFGDNKHGQLGTGSLKKVELGVKVEGYARGKGHLRNVFVTNALLEMYASSDLRKLLSSEVVWRLIVSSFPCLSFGAFHQIRNNGKDICLEIAAKQDDLLSEVVEATSWLGHLPTWSGP